MLIFVRISRKLKFRYAFRVFKYPKLLEKHLGFPYSKQEGFAKRLFPILLPFQSTAITNAEAIITESQGVKPSIAESSTMVHNLVKKLNEYSD